MKITVIQSAPRRQLTEQEQIEENFYKHINKWDDNEGPLGDAVFDIDNYLVPVEKHIGEGAWIKVPTEIGYNAYYATPHRPREDSYSLERNLEKVYSQRLLNNLEKVTGESSWQELEEGAEKLEERMEQAKPIKERMLILEIEEATKTKAGWVRIKKARNKYEYLLPTQYDLVNDIDLYQTVILAHGKDYGVTYKELYKSNDKDIIHYIMSRGISKDEAIMMAKLKEVYFICDVRKMMAKVIQPVTT